MARVLRLAGAPGRRGITVAIPLALLLVAGRFLQPPAALTSPAAALSNQLFAARSRLGFAPGGGRGIALPGRPKTARGAESEDWRDFRAKLVEQELLQQQGNDTEQEADQAADDIEEQGWAYATPLIESGSLLLSEPGDHFAINQQYFHKTVIFIVEHTDDFTRGVIFNRPTAFSTGDLSALPLGNQLPPKLLSGLQNWNVWFGGDCQGLNTRGERNGGAVFYCLHTLERLANFSAQSIIKGVYLIDLDEAQRLVAAEEAGKDDFLLLVGYCGWSPGQLQGELDRGGTWTLAAADQRALLGRLKEAQAELTVRLEAALQAQRAGSLETNGPCSTLTSTELGDGIAEWEQLYRALGPKYRQRLQVIGSGAAEDKTAEVPAGSESESDREAKSEDVGEDDEHTDDMLKRWINSFLIPPHYQAKPENISQRNLGAGVAGLPVGSILRGSAKDWILGKPAGMPSPGMGVHDIPGQYLHKAVLLLLKETYGTLLLALLNGPKIGMVENGNNVFPIHFGGPMNVAGRTDEIYEMQGKGQLSYRFQRMVLLESRVLEELLNIGAIQVVRDVEWQDILAVPVEARWEKAGGRIETVKEAAIAQLGDKQRRKWYKRMLDLDLDAGS